MIRVHTLNIDLAIAKSIPNVQFNQADVNTNVFRFIVTKADEVFPLNGYTVRLYVKKPNKTSVFVDITNINENQVELTLEQGLTNTNGTYIAELHISKEDKTLSICQFRYYVSESVSDLYAVVPSTQLTVLQDLSNRVTALEQSGGNGVSHTHSNMSVLDELSDNNGMLQYKGMDIGSGNGINDARYYTKTEVDFKLGGKRFSYITRAEYDAITTKEDDVVYVITDEEPSTLFIRDVVDGETFELEGTVTPPPNTAPTFSVQPTNVSGVQNTNITISYTATDNVGITTHEFSDDNGTTWSTITPTQNGNVYTFTRSYSTATTKTCKVRISDVAGLKTTSSSFTITITTATVSVTSVTLNKSTTTINTGSTDTLTATVAPTNATNKTVTWTSSNTGVATVSNGIVTGVSNGTATITATTQDGNFTATCSVTVQTAVIAVTGVAVAPSTFTLTSVGATQQLTPTIVPSNATNKNVTYSSSDTNVATVSASGLVTAVANGSATITVTSVDGSFTAISTTTVNIATVDLTQKAYIENGYMYVDPMTLPASVFVETVGTDSNHKYFSISTSVWNNVNKGYVNVGEHENLFNNVIPYLASNVDITQFRNGIVYANISLGYVHTNANSIILKIPNSGHSAYGGFAGYFNSLAQRFPFKVSSNVLTYKVTTTMINTFTTVSSPTTTGDGLYYRGFLTLPAGGFDGRSISAGFHSVSGYYASATIDRELYFVNATTRLNYAIPVSVIASNTITDVKKYLLTKNIEFYVEP